MMFLESPALGAPRVEWEAWKKKLTQYKRNDPSVAFALKRAESVLTHMDEFERMGQQVRVA